MKLTKKIRHGIYVEALRHYTEMAKQRSGKARSGMCWALARAAKTLWLNIPSPYESTKRFPEIHRFKPAGVDHRKMYWFPEENKLIRTRIFEQAIEETETKR